MLAIFEYFGVEKRVQFQQLNRRFYLKIMPYMGEISLACTLMIGDSVVNGLVTLKLRADSKSLFAIQNGGKGK
jgi:hypothetical protein